MSNSIEQPSQQRHFQATNRAQCKKCETLERCVSTWLDRALIKHIYPTLRFSDPIWPGQPIYRKGDELESLCIVRSGSVKVQLPLSEEKYDVDGFYFPGDIFGLCALDNKVQDHDAFALEETVICEMPLEALLSISETVPRLQKLLVDELTAKIRRQSRRLYEERHLSAESRLRFFLQSMFERNIEKIIENRGSYTLPMTKRDIALFLGMNPASLSRRLAQLEAQGVIKNHFNYIEFRDIKKIMAPIGD